MYFAAAVLDPRIKCNLIKEQYPDTADEIIERIRVYLKKEFAAPASSTTIQAELVVPLNTSLHQLGLLRRAHKPSSLAASDIDRYLDTPSLDWDEDDKSNYKENWVLDWWAANAFTFPTMAKAVRALLAVPGSEVDVERLFSRGKDLLGIRRFALKGETMRILVLLKAYFERQLNQGKVDLPEVRVNSFIIS